MRLRRRTLAVAPERHSAQRTRAPRGAAGAGGGAVLAPPPRRAADPARVTRGARTKTLACLPPDARSGARCRAPLWQFVPRRVPPRVLLIPRLLTEPRPLHRGKHGRRRRSPYGEIRNRSPRRPRTQGVRRTVRRRPSRHSVQPGYRENSPAFHHESLSKGVMTSVSGSPGGPHPKSGAGTIASRPGTVWRRNRAPGHRCGPSPGEVCL
jgi:hypothetical protein